VRHLARVLWRLAASGCAVVLIEHHTGLLSTCDRLVELGPGGGADGGRVIATGTPAELAADPDSLTGPFLARELERAAGAATRERELPRPGDPGSVDPGYDAGHAPDEDSADKPSAKGKPAGR
jgi:hypothetical protein